MEYGLLGAIIMVANIYAIFQVFSSGASTVGKLLWALGILLFPIAGFIVWLITGPRGSVVRV